jgi:hypothetical protein
MHDETNSTPETADNPNPTETAVESNLTDVDPISKPAVDPIKPPPEIIKGIPKKVDIEAVRQALPEPAGPSVVGNGEHDDVHISSLVFKTNNQSRSLSVYHLQRRLKELGYHEADRDRSGSYGDLTAVAVAKFQRDKSFEINGLVNRETAEAIFDGDPNVKLVD